MSALLTINNVTLTFPLVDRTILTNISYEINQGDFVIVLGSNGFSGKSSLLKLIDKCYHPSAGDIYFRHRNIKNDLANIDYFLSVKTLTQSTLDFLIYKLNNT